MRSKSNNVETNLVSSRIDPIIQKYICIANFSVFAFDKMRNPRKEETEEQFFLPSQRARGQNMRSRLWYAYNKIQEHNRISYKLVWRASSASRWSIPPSLLLGFRADKITVPGVPAAWSRGKATPSGIAKRNFERESEKVEICLARKIENLEKWGTNRSKGFLLINLREVIGWVGLAG